MSQDTERLARSLEGPIVDGLPDYAGIVAAMHLAPGIGQNLSGLANALLVEDFPGSTLSRGQRELLATAVSAGNDCFFCTDSHAAFAAELLRREVVSGGEALVAAVKERAVDRLDPKMSALAAIALCVREAPRRLEWKDVELAKRHGASDGDVQLTVLIAAAFCMYNRMVDGLRAKTPFDAAVYRERAGAIADHGYMAALGSARPIPQLPDAA